MILDSKIDLERLGVVLPLHGSGDELGELCASEAASLVFDILEIPALRNDVTGRQESAWSWLLCLIVHKKTALVRLIGGSGGRAPCTRSDQVRTTEYACTDAAC